MCHGVPYPMYPVDLRGQLFLRTLVIQNSVCSYVTVSYSVSFSRLLTWHNYSLYFLRILKVFCFLPVLFYFLVVCNAFKSDISLGLVWSGNILSGLPSPTVNSVLFKTVSMYDESFPM